MSSKLFKICVVICIVMIGLMIATQCKGIHSDLNVDGKVPFLQYVIQIDGCEYVVVIPSAFSTHTGIAIVHKANCKNH